MSTIVDKDLCEAVLMGMGAEVNVENTEHMGVLLEAFSLYVERTKKHGDTWKELGALNNLGRLITKVNRLRHQFWDKHDILTKEMGLDADSLPEHDLDDALDAMNYLAFFIRQARRGEWTCG